MEDTTRVIETLLRRLRGRAARDGDWFSGEERVAKYWHETDVRKDKLAVATSTLIVFHA